MVVVRAVDRTRPSRTSRRVTPVPPDLHSRPFKAHESPNQLVAYYRRMANAGVAPEVLEATPEALVTPLHIRLEDWLNSSSPTAVPRMACRILAQLRTMHRIGICHRDAHVANIVVASETPLFVDPEFATDSDSARPCYDLYGPGPSGNPGAARTHGLHTERGRGLVGLHSRGSRAPYDVRIAGKRRSILSSYGLILRLVTRRTNLAARTASADHTHEQPAPPKATTSPEPPPTPTTATTTTTAAAVRPTTPRFRVVLSVEGARRRR
jgi:hypothetical protein